MVMTFLFIVASWLAVVIRRYFSLGKATGILERFHDWRGNVIATLLGMVTPFCSCTTVPIFAGLLESQVSYGVAVSFLIASPAMDLSALVLLVSLFGLKEALIYTVVCFLVAVCMGLIMNRREAQTEVRRSFLHLADSCNIESDTSLGFMWKSFRHFFPLLLVSALFGALLYQRVPTEWLLSLTGNNAWWAVIPAVLIGAVIYADAIVMIPLGYILLEKGVNEGIVFAFMIAVTGISLPSIILLSKILRPKGLAFLIIVLLLLYILVGYLLYFW